MSEQKEQREYNDFTFSGIVSSRPIKKDIAMGTLVEATLEQTSTYRDKITITTLPITGWHDAARRMLTLKVGDHCVVSGKVKSTAYTAKSGEIRNFINMVVDTLHVTTKTEAVPVVTDNTAPAFNANDVPF